MSDDLKFALQLDTSNYTEGAQKAEEANAALQASVTSLNAASVETSAAAGAAGSAQAREVIMMGRDVRAQIEGLLLAGTMMGGKMGALSGEAFQASNAVRAIGYTMKMLGVSAVELAAPLAAVAELVTTLHFGFSALGAGLKEDVAARNSQNELKEGAARYIDYIQELRDAGKLTDVQFKSLQKTEAEFGQPGHPAEKVMEQLRKSLFGMLNDNGEPVVSASSLKDRDKLGHLLDGLSSDLPHDAATQRQIEQARIDADFSKALTLANSIGLKNTQPITDYFNLVQKGAMARIDSAGRPNNIEGNFAERMGFMSNVNDMRNGDDSSRRTADNTGTSAQTLKQIQTWLQQNGISLTNN